ATNFIIDTGAMFSIVKSSLWRPHADRLLKVVPNFAIEETARSLGFHDHLDAARRIQKSSSIQGFGGGKIAARLALCDLYFKLPKPNSVPGTESAPRYLVFKDKVMKLAEDDQVGKTANNTFVQNILGLAGMVGGGLCLDLRGDSSNSYDSCQKLIGLRDQ
ncbi:MAG: hypothetical protein ABL921_22000, partial [Pirellula sp.]